MNSYKKIASPAFGYRPFYRARLICPQLAISTSLIIMKNAAGLWTFMTNAD